MRERGKEQGKKNKKKKKGTEGWVADERVSSFTG